jgi:hypothetical protein
VVLVAGFAGIGLFGGFRHLERIKEASVIYRMVVKPQLW